MFIYEQTFAFFSKKIKPKKNRKLDIEAKIDPDVCLQNCEQDEPFSLKSIMFPRSVC